MIIKGKRVNVHGAIGHFTPGFYQVIPFRF